MSQIWPQIYSATVQHSETECLISLFTDDDGLGHAEANVQPFNFKNVKKLKNRRQNKETCENIDLNCV